MNKFKELRIEHNLSFTELAKESGVSVATLVRLEQDGKALAKTLASLARFYGLAYSEFAEFEAINPKRDRQPILDALAV